MDPSRHGGPSSLYPGRANDQAKKGGALRGEPVSSSDERSISSRAFGKDSFCGLKSRTLISATGQKGKAVFGPIMDIPENVGPSACEKHSRCPSPKSSWKLSTRKSSRSLLSSPADFWPWAAWPPACTCGVTLCKNRSATAKKSNMFPFLLIGSKFRLKIAEFEKRSVRGVTQARVTRLRDTRLAVYH